MKPCALVTGASSGIGHAIAYAYAAAGYNLSICSRSNIAALEKLKEMILSMGADCLLFQGDVADHAFCQSVVSQTLEHFHQIDVLVNNAGISHIGLFQDMQPMEWDRLLHVNLYSVISFSHAVLPSMIANKCGHIINISSVWGVCGASCEVVYSATKGAVNSFTKALAKEVAPSGIRINAIACGAIDTPMNAWMSEEEHEALLEEIPASRLGSPSEVADLCLSLTKGPSYLTAQVICLDGGWL